MTTDTMSDANPARTRAVKIRCRARSGLTADLTLRDISLGGFMVECADWTATPGEHVLVILPGLDWQPALLVWMEDGLAGFAFEELLYEPLAIHLERLIA